MRHVHDQTAIHFDDDLELGIDARSARTTATDAGTSTKKGLVIGECGQLDGGLLGMEMPEFNAFRPPGIFDELEGLLTYAVLVIPHELRANFVVLAKEI